MKKEIRYIQAAVLIFAALVYFGFKAIYQVRPAPPSVKAGESYVSKVIDGDTLKLSSGEKIRLIGVDTPEIHYSEKLVRDAKRSRQDTKTIQALGARASDFTKRLCLDKGVRLEFDVRKKDRYNRLLAYVYLEDGTFINAKILEEGYGQILTIPPNVKYAAYFRKLEDEARREKRGLWGELKKNE